MMKTFDSLDTRRQKIAKAMSDAAREVLRDEGINPRNDDEAARFDEACAKYLVSSQSLMDKKG